VIYAEIVKYYETIKSRIFNARFNIAHYIAQIQIQIEKNSVTIYFRFIQFLMLFFSRIEILHMAWQL
jgi:hypothetical protein